MEARHPLNDGRKNSSRNRFRASDPHFPNRGVCQELDVLDPLSQFIERNPPALYQRVGIERGHDTARRAIQQPNRQRMFQGSDGLRNGLLRQPEFDASLRHAAVLHHGKQDVQIAQPDAPADTAFPVENSSH
jgi:hypothetical protein